MLCPKTASNKKNVLSAIEQQMAYYRYLLVITTINCIPIFIFKIASTTKIDFTKKSNLMKSFC